LASPLPLTVGTAGHIDHGKTALVEALTGRNTDRLAEERQRGISIELGFAPLLLSDGRNLSIVDVPGHDQLVRTMISGATGIDLFLLVVAADDGVMPQTREHLAVLSALGITDGVVALTKCDLADRAAIEAALEEVRDLLPETPVVTVSAPTARGLDELRAALATAADRVETLRRGSMAIEWPEPAMLHVDRAFSLHGIGTVVTGTLRGASLSAGERIEILSRGTQARVRGLHVHDQAVDQPMPAQRVALNLAGVSRAEVGRGDVIAALDSGHRPSYRLDIELRLEAFAEDLDGQRVQIHHGTRDTPAKLVYLDQSGRFAQLRLRSPLIAASGDRVVIRRIAPPDSVGGGEVIDPVPPRHGPGKATERLRLICDGSPREVLSLALTEGPVPAEPDRWRLCPALAPALRRHSRDAWKAAARKLQDEGALIVRDGAMMRPSTEPVSAAPPREEPTTLDDADLAALEMLRADGVAPRAPQALAEALGIEREEALAVLTRLARAGAARCVRPGVYYEAATLQGLRERVIALAAERQGSISLAELRDALATSRKYAQALLEHLDSEKVLIRRGERHHLRERSASPAPL
jgi:selenocysteine-specific elongation factor